MGTYVRFFGCKSPSNKGHFLYEPGMRGVPSLEYQFLQDLFGINTFDTKFCPVGCNQKQGAANLVEANGYTCLSWWDRTGDERGNSNSSLIARGRHTFSQMIDLGKEHFPDLMNRQDEEVALWQPE